MARRPTRRSGTRTRFARPARTTRRSATRRVSRGRARAPAQTIRLVVATDPGPAASPFALTETGEVVKVGQNKKKAKF